MSEPLFWAGLIVGLFLGAMIGLFVCGLVMATRAEHEKTGH